MDHLLAAIIASAFIDAVSEIVEENENNKDKPKKEYPKIIIETDGKKTTAKMVRNVDGEERIVKESSAKCCPEDKFSLKTGTMLAASRLFEK